MDPTRRRAAEHASARTSSGENRHCRWTIPRDIHSPAWPMQPVRAVRRKMSRPDGTPPRARPSRNRSPGESHRPGLRGPRLNSGLRAANRHGTRADPDSCHRRGPGRGIGIHRHGPQEAAAALTRHPHISIHELSAGVVPSASGKSPTELLLVPSHPPPVGSPMTVRFAITGLHDQVITGRSAARHGAQDIGRARGRKRGHLSVPRHGRCE